jgi:hypothetical protein
MGMLSSVERGSSQLFPKWNPGRMITGEATSSHPTTRPHISNRYTPRLECPVTHLKQTTVVLSSRYKCRPGEGSASRWKIVTEGTLFCFLPPGGVTSWLPFRPALSNFNRYTVRIEIAATCSKQTTPAFSTRYKKPPPRGSGNLVTLSPRAPNSPGRQWCGALPARLVEGPGRRSGPAGEGG